MPTTTAIIPARMGSTRFPGKALADEFDCMQLCDTHPACAGYTFKTAKGAKDLL